METCQNMTGNPFDLDRERRRVMTKIITLLVIGILIFEIAEHVLLPLFWLVMNRNKKSAYLVTGMLNKVAEVKEWGKAEGRVRINGELWRAVSDAPFSEGDKAIVEKVEGLTLKIKPFKE
jgi:membrane protein implicated in regulation of membrane protease activity